MVSWRTAGYSCQKPLAAVAVWRLTTASTLTLLLLLPHLCMQVSISWLHHPQSQTSLPPCCCLATRTARRHTRSLNLLAATLKHQHIYDRTGQRRPQNNREQKRPPASLTLSDPAQPPGVRPVRSCRPAASCLVRYLCQEGGQFPLVGSRVRGGGAKAGEGRGSSQEGCIGVEAVAGACWCGGGGRRQGLKAGG